LSFFTRGGISRGDYDKFKQYLSDVDWDSLISSNNVNDLTTNITNAILYAAELWGEPTPQYVT
jgi:hypothetical protein